jgi:hypothetical protein
MMMVISLSLSKFVYRFLRATPLTSWPGRPKDVDGRDERGHDDQKRSRIIRQHRRTRIPSVAPAAAPP